MTTYPRLVTEEQWKRLARRCGNPVSRDMSQGKPHDGDASRKLQVNAPALKPNETTTSSPTSSDDVFKPADS